MLGGREQFEGQTVGLRLGSPNPEVTRESFRRTLHQVQVGFHGDSGQQRVNLLGRGRGPSPVEHLEHPWAQAFYGLLARFPVVPEVMSHLVRQREALLVGWVGGVQEDDAPAKAGYQAGAQIVLWSVYNEIDPIVG
nr:hypothetical protein [Calidithermus chliarophilus]